VKKEEKMEKRFFKLYLYGIEEEFQRERGTERQNGSMPRKSSRLLIDDTVEMSNLFD